MRNATVLLIYQMDVSLTLQTSDFGYYRFDDVPVGETYVDTVVSKRFTFVPQVVNLKDELTELNFTAQDE